MPARASPDSKPLARLPLPSVLQKQTPSASSSVSTKDNLRVSSNRASTAVASAIKETSPAQQRQLSRKGLVSKVKLEKEPGFAAIATAPKITFGVTKTGKIPLSDSTLRGVARHEVAHHTLEGITKPRDVPQEHLIIGASQLSGSGARLRMAPSIARMDTNKRLTTLVKLSVRPPAGGVSRQARPLKKLPNLQSQLGRIGGSGFQTVHQRKTEATGSSAQRDTVRTQMRKLGRRLKGKVDF